MPHTQQSHTAAPKPFAQRVRYESEGVPQKDMLECQPPSTLDCELICSRAATKVIS